MAIEVVGGQVGDDSAIGADGQRPEIVQLETGQLHDDHIARRDVVDMIDKAPADVAADET